MNAYQPKIVQSDNDNCDESCQWLDSKTDFCMLFNSDLIVKQKNLQKCRKCRKVTENCRKV